MNAHLHSKIVVFVCCKKQIICLRLTYNLYCRDDHEETAVVLQEVLLEYVIPSPDTVPIEDTQLLIVHRRRLLRSILYAVNQPGFSFDKLVRVQFVGEEGVDIGGPRREMFR